MAVSEAAAFRGSSLLLESAAETAGAFRERFRFRTELPLVAASSSSSFVSACTTVHDGALLLEMGRTEMAEKVPVPDADGSGEKAKQDDVESTSHRHRMEVLLTNVMVYVAVNR